jgi:hypothetical protein
LFLYDFETPLFSPLLSENTILKIYSYNNIYFVLGVKLSLLYREEFCRLKISEVMVLRRIFGPVEKYEKAGESCSMNCIVCTAHQILGDQINKEVIGRHVAHL